MVIIFKEVFYLLTAKIELTASLIVSHHILLNKIVFACAFYLFVKNCQYSYKRLH